MLLLLIFLLTTLTTLTGQPHARHPARDKDNPTAIVPPMNMSDPGYDPSFILLIDFLFTFSIALLWENLFGAPHNQPV